MAILTFAERLDARQDERRHYQGACQWRGCDQRALYVVGRRDMKTQHEDEESFRFMCQPHATLVQEMASEVER